MRRPSPNMICRTLSAMLLLGSLLARVSSAQAQDKPVLDNGPVSGESSSVVVLDFKWDKSRQTIMKPDTAGSTAPVRAVIQDNKIIERNARAQIPAGARDPNEDTIDGRSAAMEKSVQQSRSPKPELLDGFEYRAKILNASKKAIEIVFWEYQFTESSNPATVVRRQFLCAVKIKPDKEKELEAFSLSGPSDVISVGSLSNKSGKLFQEKVLINRVEYADGAIWQRKDWKFAEIKSALARATGTPWGPEMCRGL
jgi:hypothetical protein